MQSTKGFVQYSIHGEISNDHIFRNAFKRLFILLVFRYFYTINNLLFIEFSCIAELSAVIKLYKTNIIIAYIFEYRIHLYAYLYRLTKTQM
jgi:hypothetical protein